MSLKKHLAALAPVADTPQGSAEPFTEVEELIADVHKELVNNGTFSENERDEDTNNPNATTEQ